MKKLLLAVALAAITFSAPAAAYEGGWLFDDNPGGSEILALGDNSDDTYLRLGGTEYWCGAKGSSYATMRGVIGRNYPAQLRWNIANDCGDYVRVCVKNVRGERACSTYEMLGWW